MPEQRPADRWPARTDAAAKTRYLNFLQLSLSAIHKTAIWRVAPVLQSPGQQSSFTVPAVIPLRGNDGRVFLEATQLYEYGDHPKYPGDRKVSTLKYAYTLSTDEEQNDELFSWHWQSGGDHPDPHMHLGRATVGAGSVHKLHVPTGRVAFEQVLKFLLEDFGVPRARDDADELLSESLRLFFQFSSWPR